MTPEETRDVLTARRAELDAELRRLTAPPEEIASVSFGKRVGDGTTEAVERLSTTATAKSLATSIGEIDRALDKLRAGTYGICDNCGRVIPEVRMEVRPAAALCVECASRART
ncbi:MAG: TraR/DksA C4-type zinc finger protein [Acidimicrobiia bacterium]